MILITNISILEKICLEEITLLYYSVDGSTPYNVSKILYYNKSLRELSDMISNRELYWDR